VQRDGKKYALKIFTKSRLSLVDVSGMLEEVSILWHLKVRREGGREGGREERKGKTVKHLSFIQVTHCPPSLPPSLPPFLPPSLFSINTSTRT
jgi:hypothetical protein